MAYMPELDRAVSGLVRRIAWAAGKPMTSVLAELVLHVAQSVDPEKACRVAWRSSECYPKVPPRRSSARLPGLFKR